MKTKLLLVAIMLTIGAERAISQVTSFERLSNNANITSVVVTKAMISMFPTDMKTQGDINIKDIADKLDNIEIYRGQSAAGLSALKAEAEVIAKDPKYQSLMNVKDGTSNISFFAQQNKDIIKSLVMVVIDQSGESAIIRLQGNFTKEDIQNIINASSKKR